jgi:hypothetical protein
MSTTYPVGDLIRRGVQLQPHEAVALAQSVIAALADGADAPIECGPPTVETVHISADGTVRCPGCATPSVFEVGLFLDSMLPHGRGTKIPGALQYTVARALGEVDAPRFASVADVSQALTRYEDGDRRAIVAGLIARAPASPATPTALSASRMPERRRTNISATELRRHLHDADRELFLARSRSDGATSDATAAPAPAPARAPGPLPTLGLHRSASALSSGRRRSLAAAAVAILIALALTPLFLSRDRQRASIALPPAANVAPSSSDASRSQPPPEPGAPPLAQSAAPASRPMKSKTATAPPASRVVAPEPRASSHTSVVRAVARTEGPEFSPSFASAGTAVFLPVGRTADARSALVSAGSLDGDLRVMTLVDDGAKNDHVQPSPDGTRIAFDSDRDGERGVYVASHTGTDVRRVSGPGLAAVPTWSPDATRLTFARAEPDRPRVWNLWLLTLASGEMRRLTQFRDGQTWSASWFTDGRRICYTHDDRLVVFDLESGRSQEYLSPVPRRMVRTPAVSPDGQRVVFQVYRDGAWMLNLKDGSMVRTLTDPSAEEFAWSPDGRRVAFHSRRDGEWGIWMMGPP